MREQDKLTILRDLIALNTVADNETSVAIYLQDLLRKNGIDAQLVTDDNTKRANLVAEIGDGQGPVLAFAGHADTVHEGDLTTWSTDPFTLVEQDGRLYGRGTTDMKGGLAEYVIAMIEMHEQAVPLHGTLRLLVTVDEEKTEAGARLLAERGYADDIDAMVIAEPTGVALPDITDYFQSGGAVIDEATLTELQAAIATATAPEQHFIFHAHKGFLAYEVTATGKAAHSSMPKLGVNAIDHLVTYYLAEKAFYDALPEVSPVLDRTLYGPDVIRGGQQQNSVPDSATLTVLTRIIPELPPKELIARLEQLVADVNATDETMQLALHVSAYDDAVVTPKDSQLIQLIQRLVPDYLPEPMAAPAIAVSLGTDASQFIKANLNLELAVIGPGNATAHKADEYVERQAYMDMVGLYEAIAKQYLQ